jgi:hypothetical protein
VARTKHAYFRTGIAPNMPGQYEMNILQYQKLVAAARKKLLF